MWTDASGTRRHEDEDLDDVSLMEPYRPLSRQELESRRHKSVLESRCPGWAGGVHHVGTDNKCVHCKIFQKETA